MLLVAISVLFNTLFLPSASEPSVEIGIESVSPAGVAVGHALPASGCSDLHNNDCAAQLL